MRFGAIRTKWRASTQVGAKSCQVFYGHPQLAGKRLVRTMQCTQFHAKSATNDLMSPMDFLNRNFCFETDGVLNLKIFIQDLQVHGSQHFIQHEGFQALPERKRSHKLGQRKSLYISHIAIDDQYLPSVRVDGRAFIAPQCRGVATKVHLILGRFVVC